MTVDAALAQARERWGTLARVEDSTVLDGDGTRRRQCAVGKRDGRDWWVWQVLGAGPTFAAAFAEADRGCRRLSQDRRVR